VQGDQDVIGLELADGIGDDRQEAPKAVDVVGKPCESSWERRREDVDLGRRVDDRAHRGRQLVDLGDGGVRDEEQPHDAVLSGGRSADLGRRSGG
jgi:hypothetical protein